MIHLAAGWLLFYSLLILPRKKSLIIFEGAAFTAIFHWWQGKCLIEGVGKSSPALPSKAHHRDVLFGTRDGVFIMKTGYLIDMDGVIYRENQLIPGVPEFIQALIATGTAFLFLTNNSAPHG